MGARYNAIAGQSVERLAALSDGLFAVAMTLLVLDLKVPAGRAIESDQALLVALAELVPRLMIYLMSFLTLGIFLVGQQTQLQSLCSQQPASDLDPSGVPVHDLPDAVSTALMAEFITLRTAFLLYWLNILAFGALLLASWRHAKHAGSVEADVSKTIDLSVERRIFVAQALYAFGGAVSVQRVYWSIAFIMLVQLNYVIGPRIGVLARI